MRRAALALLILLVAVAPGRADMPPAGEQGAIRDVIEAQLDAFQRDDAAAAFAYASPAIRDMFGTAERFMAMVREGYAPVHRPRRVEFRDLVTERGRLTQRVYVVGPDGRPVIANYFMERQPDGSWRIDGCVLEEVPDLPV
jgi:ketosteroid isomerase-like protein